MSSFWQFFLHSNGNFPEDQFLTTATLQISPQGKLETGLPDLDPK